jgi:hypothetical protein
MSSASDYRAKAAELIAKAQQEPAEKTRTAYKLLAQSYLALAELAERNSRTDVVYETPTRPRGTANAAERA